MKSIFEDAEGHQPGQANVHLSEDVLVGYQTQPEDSEEEQARFYASEDDAGYQTPPPKEKLKESPALARRHQLASKLDDNDSDYWVNFPYWVSREAEFKEAQQMGSHEVSLPSSPSSHSAKHSNVYEGLDASWKKHAKVRVDFKRLSNSSDDSDDNPFDIIIKRIKGRIKKEEDALKAVNPKLLEWYNSHKFRYGYNPIKIQDLYQKVKSGELSLDGAPVRYLNTIRRAFKKSSAAIRGSCWDLLPEFEKPRISEIDTPFFRGFCLENGFKCEEGSTGLLMGKEYIKNKGPKLAKQVYSEFKNREYYQNGDALLKEAITTGRYES